MWSNLSVIFQKTSLVVGSIKTFGRIHRQQGSVLVLISSSSRWSTIPKNECNDCQRFQGKCCILQWHSMRYSVSRKLLTRDSAENHAHFLDWISLHLSQVLLSIFLGRNLECQPRFDSMRLDYFVSAVFGTDLFSSHDRFPIKRLEVSCSLITVINYE